MRLKRRYVNTALIINMLYYKDVLHDALLGYLITSLIILFRFVIFNIRSMLRAKQVLRLPAQAPRPLRRTLQARPGAAPVG